MTTKTNTQAASVQDGCAEVLAKHLDCSVDELSLERWDHYGLEVYRLGSHEYAIGTDEEADQAVREYVRDSAWAFRASFIINECELPSEMEEVMEAFQEKKCEGANETILALIDRSRGGFESFVEAAVAADGRGHFLSSYDGHENEEDGFFIYRIN